MVSGGVQRWRSAVVGSLTSTARGWLTGLVQRREASRERLAVEELWLAVPWPAVMLSGA
ncbi:hypothetical protein RchiOBHm_Chr1g0356071 [Rosa chinensis]|uniref:Uncharacterized protein n=1 Tax=Rosa chinensis TaxID=74649 RepID=A0A2P6SHJ0_ROSCH|nr:hypothetical protein RchiOBHm_Chr1g0356071 [Rosa chinensis]